MPGGIPAAIVVYAFFAFVLWALSQQSDTARALMVTPLWFVLLAMVYPFVRRRKTRTV